VLGYWGFCI